MPARVVITLSPEEAAGLNRLAEESLRDRRDQLRWVLRQHLELRGMISTCDQTHNKAAQLQPEAEATK